MIVCMASGEGSNFEHIVREGIKVDLLITNNTTAEVIRKAIRLNIPYVIAVKDYEAHVPESTELVILAGFMKLLSKDFISKFPTINIHPSLLPSFRGMNAVRQSLKAGVKVTGLTIHWVDEGIDTGSIVEQVTCRVAESDTEETLQNKIKKLEHTTYPRVLKDLIKLKEKRL